jgi:tetratricopeptide (TPR) repeat protein
MRANRGTASNVIAFKPARERQAKIVAAVRVVSIDYRSIVESAVNALVHNTAAARHEVYSQARGIVRRHLQLMRLPAPIVEVEKLALDLTIRKIERHWRSRQSAEAAIPDMPEEPEPEESAVDMPRTPSGAFLRAAGSAVMNVVLWPLFTLVWALLLPVRMIARFATSPIGFAAVIPFTIMAILIVYFADETATYKKYVGEPAGRLMSSLEVHTSTPRGRNKSADRVQSGAPAKAQAGDTASASLPSPPAAPAFQLAAVTAREATAASAPPAFKAPPMRTAAVAPAAAIAALPLAVADLDELPAVAETPPVSDSPPYRGPTRVRPIRAAFPGPLAPSSPAARVATMTPGTPANPCDPLPLAERIACATKDTSAADASAVNFDSRPKWLAGYAVVRDIMTPRRPAPPTPAAPAQSATAPAQSAAAAATAPAASDAKAGATAVAAVTPANQADGSPTAQAGSNAAPPKTVIRPANPKLAALLESGRKWSTKGDLDRAAHDFTEAIRVDPKYPDSYAERGQVMFKMGETERAIADYTTAIQRDPQHGSAMRSRGMAYLYRGSSDLALTDLTRAIELAEKDPTALAPIELFYARRSRASLYDAKQQWDREIGDCTALIDAQTNDPMVAEALKQNYGEPGAANVLAGVYRQRATAHIRQSEWEAAIEDLTAAVPLSADRGFAALMDRSKLHEARGQREEAIADLQTALAARPGSEEVRLALRRLGAAPRPPPGAF